MKKYVIRGGNPLNGKVVIDSAKNSVLPIIAACVLTDSEIRIKNCPKIGDVFSMLKIMRFLGAEADFCGNDLVVCCNNIENRPIPSSLTEGLRSSFFLAGPLIARFKKAKLCFPGGCKIGKRPIDIHLDIFRRAGVVCSCDLDGVVCRAEKVCPITVFLPFPSVGATENAMMLAVLTEGESVIQNAAKEPEICDLARFLRGIGAKISGDGTDKITIIGVSCLHGGEFLPSSDRIESATFAALVATCGGKVDFFNAKAENFIFFRKNFDNISCKMSQNNDIITLTNVGRCASFEITTAPYPGVPTDIQAPLVALACIADGVSRITETVFENRFSHIHELIKLGADIRIDGRTAIVNGKDRLYGANLFACDLRGGAALTIAALAADGVSEVYGVEHIERGYANFEKKLSALGADISLIDLS